ALKKRGELDALPALIAFGEALEKACRNTLNSGKMTGDLAAMAKPGFSVTVLNSEEFLDAVAEELTAILASS
ncbi:MAG: NADP-dependent isocitrate dehydrogenase, partial [Oscillospiraceae bacterium]|nr:NADP-dependent isocitrate dehydrogenase [Oscillospiraceae bacterium]